MKMDPASRATKNVFILDGVCAISLLHQRTYQEGRKTDVERFTRGIVGQRGSTAHRDVSLLWW